MIIDNKTYGNVIIDEFDALSIMNSNKDNLKYIYMSQSMRLLPNIGYDRYEKTNIVIFDNIILICPIIILEPIWQPYVRYDYETSHYFDFKYDSKTYHILDIQEYYVLLLESSEEFKSKSPILIFKENPFYETIEPYLNMVENIKLIENDL